jgi:NAD+ dependent glucose-6-phosphate dehydrogenase
MTDVYFKASYNILQAAVELGIHKVVFASSNHVTDFYEKDGNSLLGREITIQDYPYSKGLYGILKLASENLGHMFAHQHQLSVINIRIGSVPKDEREALRKKPRLTKTLLSRPDTVGIFQAAIESGVRFGTYYGVSDNPGKPWSTDLTKSELGFTPVTNTKDLMVLS